MYIFLVYNAYIQFLPNLNFCILRNLGKTAIKHPPVLPTELVRHRIWDVRLAVEIEQSKNSTTKYDVQEPIAALKKKHHNFFCGIWIHHLNYERAHLNTF